MSRLVPIKANQNLRNIRQTPVIEITRKGDLLCYEKCGGRWFRSSRWDVEDALAQFQGLYENVICVNLNDLYRLLDIYESNLGSIYGWNSAIHGEGTTLIKINMIDKGFMQMDEPVLVIIPVVFPEKNYKEAL